MRIPLGLRAAAGATGPVGPSNPWDIGYASFTGTPQGWFNVNTQEPIPQGVTFKDDGTKMYVTGTFYDSVHEYSLSTAWVVGTASYVQSFSVATQAAAPNGLAFKSDGTELYIIGSTSDSVIQYSLSTAWDISTASYTQSFSVSAQEGLPHGLFFKPDGTKMYVIGQQGDDVNEYNLSTAWDLSTARVVQAFSVAAKETTPRDVFFKPDGTVMYICGTQQNRVNVYSLSTAWDVSTAIFTTFFSGTLGEDPNGLYFKSDGTKVFFIGQIYDNVLTFNLSTAWDITTASLALPSIDFFSVAAQDTQVDGLFFKGDGTALYIAGDQGDTIEQYSLSTAWAVHTASYVQTFDVSAKETIIEDVFFKTDGTKMYIIGRTVGDFVNEYALSTAWDISTATWSQNFSVAPEETNPTGFFFKDDGTKMYVCGGSDEVNEYTLSTAWDVSTASYVQAYSVATENTSPASVFFKDDGTKMYVVNSTDDDLDEYSLSTAWDVSTASFTQNNPLTFGITRGPSGVFFRSDGGKMYISDSTLDAIIAYTIS